MRSRFLCLLILLLVAPRLRAQEVPDFSSLEKTAAEELAATRTPGAAVAVISGDRIVFSKGFGVANVETGTPVTPDTLFHVGSLTKVLTAAAVAAEAEVGRLRLDAPVGGYVLGLAPRIARLTLDQLLAQTSGLRDVPGEDGLHGEDALGIFVRSLKDDDLLVAPGRAFSYSNAGYALAGYVLESAGGKPYADRMDEILFRPLGMTRTTLRPLMAVTHPLAMGHTARGEEAPKVVRPLADDTRLWPAGYAFTSLSDLSRFVLALLNGGKVDSRQALPPGVAARLLAPHIEIPTNVFVNGAYGYGLFLQDDRGLRRAEHGGELPGYGAEIRTFPERRVAVIVLANREAVRFNKTFEKAFDLLLGPKPAAASVPSPEPLPMSPREMTSYAGTYANRWSVDLFVKDGRLVMRRFGTELPVIRIGEHRFSVTPEGGTPQEFLIVPGANGKPEYLQMFVWIFRKTG
ncbi:MAG TPA: serine hydrolase domain-containing protein [Thermoanaerobaculia bacterium]|jgi:CubicO group peptidase (beta-lactamase class C family)